MASSERLNAIQRHLSPQNSENSSNKTPSNGGESVFATLPKRRQELLKWNGWGYNGSQFAVEEKTGHLCFTGDRYHLGGKVLPDFKNWVQEKLVVDLSKINSSQNEPDDSTLPPPVINEPFARALEDLGIAFSFKGKDRLFRAHGHTLREVFLLRQGQYDRIPDLVVWPNCHEDVVKVVNLCKEHNVVIIPIGGGTSVSGALMCPAEERRMIISLDLTQMNRILWVDRENLVIRAEAGIIGQTLEAQLKKVGLCTGHEPDSHEFSSLGGWVATRASGMKRNVYGNIEDLLVHVRMVTPQGTVERSCQVPRLSSGPDIHHFILGSEGTLGVVTEVTLKVKPLPPCQKYGSLIFHDFEAGIAFLREVNRQQLHPASIRLMDNEQFVFGQAIKPEDDSLLGPLVNAAKKMYVLNFKGYDVEKMCVVTLLFEGTHEEVDSLEKSINRIATSFQGMPAGEENGKRGYILTFLIAYIRDLGLDYNVVAESFETSAPWDRVPDLCKNVKDRVKRECASRGVCHTPFISCRVTQTYDAGACIYFYFAFNYRNIDDPVHLYEEVETSAREEIISCGGSISHHHGVGKIRKQWLQQTVSPAGLGMLRAIKSYIDPSNIFGNGNLML